MACELLMLLMVTPVQSVEHSKYETHLSGLAALAERCLAKRPSLLNVAVCESKLRAITRRTGRCISISTFCRSRYSVCERRLISSRRCRADFGPPPSSPPPPLRGLCSC